MFRIARLTSLALVLSMPIGMLVFYWWRNVHLLGIAHLAAWLPLLIYLVKGLPREAKKGKKWAFSKYTVKFQVMTIAPKAKCTA